MVCTTCFDRGILYEDMEYGVNISQCQDCNAGEKSVQEFNEFKKRFYAKYPQVEAS